MNQERFLDLPTGGMVMAFIHSFHSLFCCGIEPLAQIGFRVQGAQKDLESFYQPVRTNISGINQTTSFYSNVLFRFFYKFRVQCANAFLLFLRALTMSPEQFQYIWRKTIPHIYRGRNGIGCFHVSP
jgi:hypothetical protein